ncbi:CBASS oligonucleotide cyclase [Aurantiacibacter poecillastricola]|uniref:CBASS oligonucleotide cyclase n=1 Tax=Aurantiacibacter poecillastricola TaxID=3064385 RepID=UPI00273FF22E|nr:CBASS oligonucleotide cyclase [Aurantiacibacter sp. 219JJ12-13]MDP5260588.1 CBASS oligonucleotide cyclase [Aurantiacibacter sp. 219JJ12-13]
MALNDAQLRRYDSNVLRLPAEKRKEYHEQVDRLIDNLCKNVRNKTEIKITKVVKAGSFAKFTILRRTSEDPVDVDVVFYIGGKDADAESLESLSSQIHDLLVDQYPNKSVEDFKIQRKAATVQFVGSGLAVDIVPVIEDDTRDGYGWQFDLSDGSKMETCAPCQIKFVRDRKNADKDFRTLVRMGKRWRNRAEIKLKSFMIELIFAYLLDRDGPEGGIEQKFRDFLLYIAQSGLKETISFPENSAFFRPQFDDPVVILDPVCSSNNVASRVTEGERLEIVAAAQEAWEVAYFASTEDDDEVWKEIFGPKFNTEDA